MQVHEGLIWVYGSSGKEAFEESKIVGRPSSPKVGHPDFMAVPGWFMRELPYGADVLAENVSFHVYKSDMHALQILEQSKSVKACMFPKICFVLAHGITGRTY